MKDSGFIKCYFCDKAFKYIVADMGENNICYRHPACDDHIKQVTDLNLKEMEREGTKKKIYE